MSTANYYYNYPNALKKAQKEKKWLLVFWTANWCQPCQMMKNQVFPHSKIQKVLQKYYIVCFLPPEHKSYREKSHNKGIPDWITENPYTKKTVKRPSQPGYQNVNQFFSYLKMKIKEN